MHIKEYRTRNKKTGKVYIKHQLVESYRTKDGPRHRVVMNLGKLKVEKSQWKKLAFALEGRLSGQDTLIEDPRVASEAERVLANYDFYRLRKKKEDAPVSIIPLKIGLKFYMNIENFMMIIYPDKILLIYYNC